jgi:hypothetical protein
VLQHGAQLAPSEYTAMVPAVRLEAETPLFDGGQAKPDTLKNICTL